MTEVLRALQVLTVLTWTMPLVLFWRAPLRRSQTSIDRIETAVWFMSLSAALFPLRWLVFPAAVRAMPLDEAASWGAVYVLGIVAAVGLTLAAWTLSHERP